MLDVESCIFTEKYRPKHVKDVIGDFKDKIMKYMEDQSAIPNFLFHSTAPGTGKCLVEDEMFLSKNGLISFKEYSDMYNIKNQYTDLKDSVFCSENGIVDTQYFYKSKSKTIKIETSRGYEIEGTPEHKIKVFNNDGFVWKSLIDINSDDYIPIIYNTNFFNNDNNIFNYSKFNIIKKKKGDYNSIMIKKPKEINNDIAYLIGVFIANGSYHSNSISISTFKPWLQDKLLKIVENEFGLKGRYMNDKNKKIGVVFQVWLSRFFETVLNIERKTARWKQIPKIIRCSSKSVQMNFIDGLFEDGWISREGYIEISTASEKLVKQLQIMFLNLGFLTTKRKKYLKEYDHWYHTLTLSVEHSKKFVDYFDGYFKNKKIVFKENMNTNVLSYKNIISDYIKYKRKQNNIKRIDLRYLHLQKRSRKITGYIPKVIKNLQSFIDKEPYLDELNLLVKLSPFLDTLKTKIYNKKKDIYDFHIPDTHSFWASGMINHNTTISRAIINDLGCDSLFLNSSDDRKIDVIREKVKEFSMTRSSKIGKRRAIFLDEFDGMLRASQDALRTIMETYAKNCFYLLACNNINKVIEPIISRCVVIPFAYPKREEIAEYLVGICEKENMAYDLEGIQLLIEMNYPKIRNCVLTLQDLKTQKLSVKKENIKPANEIFDSLLLNLKEKNWRAIKESVMATTVDPRELNIYFWEYALKNENIKILQVCCRNERDIALGSNPKVIMVTSLIEMCK